MLKDILEFFKRERIYGLLFFILVGIYGTFFFLKDRVPETQEDTKILDQFKKAEDKVQSKVKDLGSLEAYLKDRPQLAFAVNLFSVFLVIAFFAGTVLDFLFFHKPEFRARLHLDRAPPAVNWKFSLLFKFFIWFFLLNVIAGLFLLGAARFLPESENLFMLLHTACAEIISFVVIYGLVRKHGGKGSDIGLSIPQGKWFREMKMGWTVYIGILPIFGAMLMLLLLITNLFHYEPPPHPLVPMLLEGGEGSQFLIVCSLFLAVVCGPIFEEIFFRGFCYPVLKQRFGSLTAMVVTSSFFAFIHDSTFAFWPIFILGMALNYVYEKRGSLVANITLHITHNAIFLAYFFLAKNIISREMGV